MRPAAVVIAFCIALSGLASAQEQRGSVEGTVRDATGVPSAGAAVEASSPSLVGSLRTTSSREGVYRFPALPPGRYAISASMPGLSAVRRLGIDVGLGIILRVDLTLVVAREQEVVVTGDVPVIDVKQSASFTTFDADQISRLPRGRDFTTLVGLAAGAGVEAKLAGISIDGASGSENRFVIDGIDTTNLQNGLSAKQLVTEAVQEIQVKSSGYAAEFGGSTGGVINVVTKSGSNDFHGDLGVQYSSNALNGPARPSQRFGLVDNTRVEYVTYPEDPTTTWEPGLALGGPVLRDRLWFFLAYAPRLQSADRAVTFTRNGQTRTFTQDDTTEFLSANLTSQLTPALSLRIATNLSPHERNGTLPSVDGTSEPSVDFAGQGQGQPNGSVSGSLDFVASPSVLFGLRGGFFRYNTFDTGISDEVLYSCAGSNLQYPGIPPELRCLSGYSNILTNSAITRDIQSRASLQLAAPPTSGWRAPTR